MGRFDKPPKLGRDIFMVLLGATMSFTSSFYTLNFTSKNALKKEKRDKMSALLNEMAGYTGHRLFLISEIYKSKRDTATADLKRDLDLYFTSQDIWNQKQFLYYPALNDVEGNYAAEFDSLIYVPMVKLGKSVTNKNFDTGQSKKFMDSVRTVVRNTSDFFQRLHDARDSNF